MAKMSEIFPILFRAIKGRMSKDLDRRYLQGGDFIHSLNTRSTTTVGNSTGDRESVVGNTLAYTLPVVGFQNVIYRIYLNNTANLRTVTIFDGNGVQVGLPATWTPTGAAGGLATAYTNATTTAVTSIGARLTAAGWTAGSQYIIGALVVTDPDVSGYFTLELGKVTGWGYTLTMASAYDDPTPLIIQEAIDFSMTGQLQTIGSYDLLGDLFVWSTTQNDLPSDIDIIAITNLGGLFRVQIPDTTVFQNNQELVVISGVTGSTGVNGNWIINITDATHFTLLGSAFNGTPVAGVVTINSEGLGEIGVAIKDENTQSWTYTTLLRSKEFNFRTLKQPKTYCERNDRLASLYWTDNYNVPRVLYYIGAYLTNGALTFVDPLNEYEYGNIASETKLIENTSFFNVAFQDQLQSGGTLKAGNWRYVARLLTDNLTPTLWSDLTNPVNVCVANVYSQSPNQPTVGGNDADTITGKINELMVSGIIPNLFKYAELGAIYYADGVPTGYVIRRDLLTQETTQLLQHRGDETNVQNLDLATLSAVQTDIVAALNIDAVDNRLVLSNTRSSASIDFSDWTNTWTHTISRASITGVRVAQVTNNFRTGEYIVPENVNGKAGYMFNEIYRFGAKFKLRSGFITETFWIDDVRFDCLTTNSIANPTSNRRIGSAIPTYDLTDVTGDTVYVPNIEFNGIDLDTVVNGVRVGDVVEEIVIERVDLTDGMIEVIGTGVCLPSYALRVYVSPTYRNNFFPVTMTRFATGNPNLAGSTFNDNFSEYPFASGASFYADIFNSTPFPDDPDYATVGSLDSPTSPPWPFTGASLDARVLATRDVVSFYSPDFIYSNRNYSFLTGDSIVNFGNPASIIAPGYLIGSYGHNGGCAFYSTIKEYNGFCNKSTYPSSGGVRGIDVTAGQVIAMGGSGTVAGRNFNKLGYLDSDYYNVPHTPTIPPSVPLDQYTYYYPESPVLEMSANITNANGASNTDFGCYYSQYYRFKGSVKFGAIANSKYVTTGSYLKVAVNQTGTTLITGIFGGDTFTQKSYLKHRIPQTTPSGGVNDFMFMGFGGGFGYYSQNRVNTQMRNVGIPATSGQFIQYQYPAIAPNNWLEPVEVSNAPVYNTGYNIINGVAIDNGFDVNLIRDTHQPARMWWSEIKPENSQTDNYRIILPRNFKDADLSYGEIQHHLNINGNLQIWQQRAFVQEYFNSTALLPTNAEDVVLGNSGVMTRKGTTLSTYGTKHGFSVIKGRTKAGKDCTYWINSENGKVMRHQESDGTVCISDFGMSSFFGENLKFADGYNTPAHGEGICGVWNDRNSEAIWTVRAYKSGIEEWEASVYDYASSVWFSSGTTGKEPKGSLLNIAGIFYGMTFQGGANSNGTIFKYNATTFALTKLFDFDITDVAKGGFPYGSLILATNGLLYGMVHDGGANGFGAIFSFDTGTNTYTIVHDFALLGGANPFGDLIEFGANIFYGVTNIGGANNFGCLFRYNANTTTFSVLHSFVAADGEFPQGSLIRVGSIFYGLNQIGGANNCGTIFSYDTGTSTFAVLHDFALAGGSQPLGSLFRATDGKLYGTTSLGGLYNKGVLFNYNIGTNTFTSLYDFGEIIGIQNDSGENPSASLVQIGNYLYGTCPAGGANSVGTVWSWDVTNGIFLPIHDAVTGNGFGSGSVYLGSLISYNGVLYGLASVGGASAGSIFQIDITLSVYNEGDAVSYGTTDFEGFPDFYVSLIDGNNNHLPTDTTYWEKVSRDNYYYYNLYTIVFNELANSFDTFYSFLPKIYLQYKNTYLSPRPIDNQGKTYEHGRGLYLVWYDTQAVDGHFVSCAIANPADIKRFMAIVMRTQTTPFRVDIVASGGQQTYMDAADFLLREMNYYAGVRNDTTGTGVNNGDTSRLIGDLATVDLTFQTGVYQKLFMWAVRSRSRMRKINT